MATSEGISSIAKALSKAQAEVENAAKNAINPHFKSKYADLAEIINTVRPIFTAHGISIVQSPSFENGICTVETMLLHDSGEWISGKCQAPVSRSDIQSIGSAITYLRRYSLAAFCLIAQEDNDGNEASNIETQPADRSSFSKFYKPVHPEPKVEEKKIEPPKTETVVEPKKADAWFKQPETKPAPKTGELTPKDFARLFAGAKKAGEAAGVTINDEMLSDFGHFRFGKDHKSEWTRKEYDLCVAWLETIYKTNSWIDYKENS